MYLILNADIVSEDMDQIFFCEPQDDSIVSSKKKIIPTVSAAVALIVTIIIIILLAVCCWRRWKSSGKYIRSYCIIRSCNGFLLT